MQTNLEDTMSQAPTAHIAIKLDFIDLPDLPETFTDSLHNFFFDGQSLRLTFCVTRYDDPNPPAPQTAKRYPACRLVLSPTAALQLIDKMQQVHLALAQAAIIKQNPDSLVGAPTTGKAN